MVLIPANNRSECNIDTDDNGDIVIDQHLLGKTEQTIIITTEYAQKLVEKLLPTAIEYAETGNLPDA